MTDGSKIPPCKRERDAEVLDAVSASSSTRRLALAAFMNAPNVLSAFRRVDQALQGWLLSQVQQHRAL